MGVAVLAAGLIALTDNSSADVDGSLHSAMTLRGTTSSLLYPGSSSTVKFTVENESPGHELLGTVHLASIVACDKAFVSGACPSGHVLGTCESINDGAGSNPGTANFYMADVASNQGFAIGSGQTVRATGTLTMNDLASSQDICRKAHLLLNLISWS